MSYAAGAELQAAVYALLAGDAALDALLGPGGGVFDGLPPTGWPARFVALGPEDVRVARDASGAVCRHEMVLSVVARRGGFAEAKRAAARVAALLDGAALPLAEGRVLGIALRRARARVDEGEGVRRVDLWVRARVDVAEG